MFSFLLSFVSSALLTLLVIKHSILHGPALDNNFSGVQKVHSHAVARIGGLPIFLAVMLAAAISVWRVPALGDPLLALMGCASIAFIGGIAEDYTGRVHASGRLVLTMVAAILAFIVLDAKIGRLDLPFMTWQLHSSWITCH